MPFDWNKFKDGDRFKFVNVGDHIEGSLVQLGVTDFGGQADATPELHLRTENGAVVTVTASQTVLCSRLAEQAPEIGDYVSITYTGEDPKGARPGRSPAKLFDVIVKRGEGNAATATPTAPPPPAAASSALPAVPGYPAPTAAQLADPAYRTWYESNVPKAPAPPPPPPADDDQPF